MAEKGIFEDIKFYIIATKESDISAQLSSNGANRQSFLSERVTFAVSDDPNAGEVGEALDLYDVPVITSHWVKRSLEVGKKLPFGPFHPNMAQLFTGVVAVSTELSQQDRLTVSALISIRGGGVRHSLDSQTTHLILGKGEGKLHDYARKNLSDRVSIVTPDWVTQSVTACQLLPAEDFDPRLLKPPTPPKPPPPPVVAQQPAPTTIVSNQQFNTTVSNSPALVSQQKQHQPAHMSHLASALNTSSAGPDVMATVSNTSGLRGQQHINKTQQLSGSVLIANSAGQRQVVLQHNPRSSADGLQQFILQQPQSRMQFLTIPGQQQQQGQQKHAGSTMMTNVIDTNTVDAPNLLASLHPANGPKAAPAPQCPSGGNPVGQSNPSLVNTQFLVGTSPQQQQHHRFMSARLATAGPRMQAQQQQQHRHPQMQHQIMTGNQNAASIGSIPLNQTAGGLTSHVSVSASYPGAPGQMTMQTGMPTVTVTGGSSGVVMSTPVSGGNSGIGGPTKASKSKSSKHVQEQALNEEEKDAIVQQNVKNILSQQHNWNRDQHLKQSGNQLGGVTSIPPGVGVGTKKPKSPKSPSRSKSPKSPKAKGKILQQQQLQGGVGVGAAQQQQLPPTMPSPVQPQPIQQQMRPGQLQQQQTAVHVHQVASEAAVAAASVTLPGISQQPIRQLSAVPHTPPMAAAPVPRFAKQQMLQQQQTLTPQQLHITPPVKKQQVQPLPTGAVLQQVQQKQQIQQLQQQVVVTSSSNSLDPAVTTLPNTADQQQQHIFQHSQPQQQNPQQTLLQQHVLQQQVTQPSQHQILAPAGAVSRKETSNVLPGAVAPQQNQPMPPVGIPLQQQQQVNQQQQMQQVQQHPLQSHQTQAWVQQQSQHPVYANPQGQHQYPTGHPSNYWNWNIHPQHQMTRPQLMLPNNHATVPPPGMAPHPSPVVQQQVGGVVGNPQQQAHVVLAPQHHIMRVPQSPVGPGGQTMFSTQPQQAMHSAIARGSDVHQTVVQQPHHNNMVPAMTTVQSGVGLPNSLPHQPQQLSPFLPMATGVGGGGGPFGTPFPGVHQGVATDIGSMVSAGHSGGIGGHSNNLSVQSSAGQGIRLPQYVCIEGDIVAKSKTDCLMGCVFYMFRLKEIKKEVLDEYALNMRKYGAEIMPEYDGEKVTHVIMDNTLEDPDFTKQLLQEKKRIVTIYWVNDVLDIGYMKPPFQIIHLPSPFSKFLTWSHIRKQIISLTGFSTGIERETIRFMVKQIGAVFTDYLDATNTVLICKRPEGKKYELAQRRGMPCVNVRWLQDLYFGDLTTLKADMDHKYLSFEKIDVSFNLDLYTHQVQDLMVGWLSPMKFTQGTVARHEELQSQLHKEENIRKRKAQEALANAPEAKKIKRPKRKKKKQRFHVRCPLTPLTEEEMELAMTCPLRQPPPVVPSPIQTVVPPKIGVQVDPTPTAAESSEGGKENKIAEIKEESEGGEFKKEIVAVNGDKSENVEPTKLETSVKDNLEQMAVDTPHDATIPTITVSAKTQEAPAAEPMDTSEVQPQPTTAASSETSKPPVEPDSNQIAQEVVNEVATTSSVTTPPTETCSVANDATQSPPLAKGAVDDGHAVSVETKISHTSVVNVENRDVPVVTQSETAHNNKTDSPTDRQPVNEPLPEVPTTTPLMTMTMPTPAPVTTTAPVAPSPVVEPQAEAAMPLIAFTGLTPEERTALTDLIQQIDGKVVESATACSHLVASHVIRTPKFYHAILRGCHIVQPKWIQASALRNAWLDEKHWQLEDPNVEEQYGICLSDSLQRARDRILRREPGLFDTLEFWLSPSAKHREVCIDLIRSCGGQIREKRPTQKMALLSEPKQLIICHEEDCHLANYLMRTKTGNKAVHHEEFVLSGVMQQKVDYESYQIQYVATLSQRTPPQSATPTKPRPLQGGGSSLVSSSPKPCRTLPLAPPPLPIPHSSSSAVATSSSVITNQSVPSQPMDTNQMPSMAAVKIEMQSSSEESHCMNPHEPSSS